MPRDVDGETYWSRGGKGDLHEDNHSMHADTEHMNPRGRIQALASTTPESESPSATIPQGKQRASIQSKHCVSS